MGGRPFPTRVLKRDLIEHVQGQPFDFVARVVLRNFELLDAGDRLAAIGIRNAIAMENKNLDEERRRRAETMSALSQAAADAAAKGDVNVQVDLERAVNERLMNHRDYREYLYQNALPPSGPR